MGINFNNATRKVLPQKQQKLQTKATKKQTVTLDAEPITVKDPLSPGGTGVIPGSTGTMVFNRVTATKYTLLTLTGQDTTTFLDTTKLTTFTSGTFVTTLAGKQVTTSGASTVVTRIGASGTLNSAALQRGHINSTSLQQAIQYQNINLNYRRT